MASRMINYGYQIKNASVEIMEGEAMIVREIFGRCYISYAMITL